MKKRTIIFLGLFLALTQTSFSQKVKLKKRKVLLDGKEILSYEKRGFGTEITFYSLKNNEEIAEMYQENNGTNTYIEDDYKVMFFSTSEIKIESSRIHSRGWKYVIKLLIKNKVLDVNGQIDSEKLKKFAKKYDENITNRTIRY